MNNIEELLEIVSITIQDKEFNIELLTNAVEVDSSNLDAEFARHCKLVMIAGFAYEKSLANANRLEVELERAYASLDCQIREQAKMANVKLTEKMVENSVIGHVEYQELQDRVLQAQEATAMLKVARDSMQHRRDCLIGMSANHRAEMQAEPSLRYGK